MKILITVLALLASVRAQACRELEVNDAWIRATPPGSAMTVGYASLRNRGKDVLHLRGGHSSAFAEVMLHRTVLENGVYRMRGGQTLDIAPGASAALAPEGWHLMLMNPARPLAPGDTVRVALDCGAGSSEFTFTVKTDVE